MIILFGCGFWVLILFIVSFCDDWLERWVFASGLVWFCLYVGVLRWVLVLSGHKTVENSRFVISGAFYFYSFIFLISILHFLSNQTELEAIIRFFVLNPLIWVRFVWSFPLGCLFSFFLFILLVISFDGPYIYLFICVPLLEISPENPVQRLFIFFLLWFCLWQLNTGSDESACRLYGCMCRHCWIKPLPFQSLKIIFENRFWKKSIIWKLFIVWKMCFSK